MILRLLPRCLLLLPGLSWGQLPDYYPDPLPRTGNVDRIDHGERITVVSDTLYLIDPQAPVHTPENINTPLSSIQVNDQIAFEHQGNGQQKLITEIWKLPAGGDSGGGSGGDDD